jgi:hypothetical protein
MPAGTLVSCGLRVVAWELLAWSTGACVGPLGGGGPDVTITVAADGGVTTLYQARSLRVMATVMHAGGNPAVRWSLSGCAGDCGTLSDVAGNPVTYTAPQVVTASLPVTLTAAAVVDASKTASVTLTIQPEACPSGNEAALTGQYAFVLHGNEDILGIVGSFAADGAGTIAGGVVDVWPGSLTSLTIQPGGSSYSAGPDNRGCLTLVTSDGVTRRFRFAVGGISAGVATRGRVIEFDDSSGRGTRAEGILRRQDPAAFTTSSVRGAYAFAWVGADTSGGRIAAAGAFTATSNGVASEGGQLDVNHAGAVAAPQAILGGWFNVGANGRGTIGFSVAQDCDICGGSGFGGVIYLVSPREVMFLSTPGTFPVLTGEILQQQSGPFDANALDAVSIVRVSGFRNGAGGPEASIGQLMPDGGGSVDLVLDTNEGGTPALLESTSGSYVVAPNGRVATSGLGAGSPLLYLIDINRGLVLGTDSAVTFGSFEPQSGAPFTNASVSGRFFFGMDGAQAATRLMAAGSLVFDGQGSYSGTEDDSMPTGLAANHGFAGIPYAFSATSAQLGRGALDGGGKTVAYVVSPTELVYIDTKETKPRVVVLEQ